MGKIGCVVIVKNEERHIAEWLAWQFFIGFDTVFLLNNESTDGTRAIAESFAPRYDVRVLDWPGRGPGVQERAYEHAIGLLKDEFEWLGFFDADEFLVLDEGLELKALLTQRREAAVGVPWAFFGSSGHVEYPQELVIEAFARRAPADFHANAHIKSIIRPRMVKRAYNPHAFEVEGEYVDIKGRPLAFDVPGVLMEAPEHNGAKLHHYFTRSRAHWQARLERGNLATPRVEEDFHYYNRNEVQDDSAARHAAEIRRIIASAVVRETVALVLIVKDEASDILAWLAWHRLLGFDAAIVYDDDSTDETWALLQEAAKHWDIRLHRAEGDRSLRYECRQEASYRHALQAYRDEFDWLAFFDADEFLQLRLDRHVAGFLARFPEADEVAVNWCKYGSSGHVLKPEAPAPLAYTWHGNTQRPVNQHVKCFVRPNKVGPRWVSFHCFDVAPEKAVLANNAPLVWSATPGIIAGTPDWSVAKLMHYQCRSMEHFIERMKRRPNIKATVSLWTAYDVRDEEDTAPLAMAGALIAGIEALRGEKPVAAPVEENRLIFDIGMAEGDDTALYLAKGFRVVGLEPSAKTYYGLCERFAAEIKAGQLTVLNYAAGRETGQILEFFHNDKHPRLSGFSAERPEFASGFTSYHVVTIGWAELVAEYGVPHYAKIDIEGAEVPFLAGAEGAALPAYISVECHDLGPAEALYKLGYRRFQLSDQNPPGGYAWPDPPREGQKAEGVDVNHTSGPFGRELPPDWLEFEAFCAAWRAAKAQGRPTWYDCHAALA